MLEGCSEGAIEKYFLLRRDKYGLQYNLRNIYSLLSSLNSPHKNLKVIHIAGTNGKGSLVSYISSILKKSGLKVGSFSSPYYKTPRDMYEINCREVSYKRFCRYFREVEKTVKELENKKKIYPTEFEIQVAIAFVCFYFEKCDVVVLETGCGGLYDATNVIEKPLLTILTSIDYDHTNILGTTLQEITHHKCGIIKEGVPVVTISNQREEVLEQIKKECINKHSPLFVAEIGEIKKTKISCYKQSFCYKNKKYNTKLRGVQQFENAFLAIKACEVLTCLNKNISIREESIRKGLAMAYRSGRFEVIKHSGRFILDGAHNPSAAKKLKINLSKIYKNKKCVFIFGMFKDKNAKHFAETLLSEAVKIFLVPLPNVKRSYETKNLKEILLGVNDNIEECETIDEAIKKARRIIRNSGITIVCGSFSFLYLARESIFKNNNNILHSKENIKKWNKKA